MSEELQVNEAAEQATTPETVETPQVETAEQEGEQTQAEKTFTQAELDAIVQKEKARAESKAERKAKAVYQEALSKIQPQQDNLPEDGRMTQEEWESYNNQQQTIKKADSIYKEAAKIDGFDVDDFDSLPLTQSIAAFILESDNAPKLMKYLTDNPDDVERIGALSETRQSIEMDKLAEKLKAAPKTSNAPPPIKPVGHGGTGAPITLENASMDEYVALRIKQGASWAR